MRRLHRDCAAHTVLELAEDLGVAFPKVSYHSAVLASAGKLDKREESGRILFESSVAGDPQVESMLSDTAAEDEPGGDHAP